MAFKLMLEDVGNGADVSQVLREGCPVHVSFISSESKCHLRIVIFRRVPFAQKKKNIAHKGVPRGSE